jgi:Domain of Unknown Function (DUF349)
VSTANDPWGRVADDGTVYVRIAGSERVVGSWQAGSPDEALAFYRRKFDALETEVALLEQRLTATDLSPGSARASIDRLLEAVADAHAVGDLESLRTRLEALTGQVEGRREEVRAAREQARVEAKGIKERIVAEAEQIAAEATHWKISGERMRQLLEEWKVAPRADRAVETALWKRLSTARNSFAKRRKAYFAGLEEERGEAKSRKEKLVAEAEALATSTDWGPTAGRYRELMRQWKAAGPAPRDVDDALWKRFRGAQDVFFGARDAAVAEQDQEFAANAEVKEKLLVEAEALLPDLRSEGADLDAAKRAFRDLADRWDAAGKVPRDRMRELEGRIRRVEQEIRGLEDEQWRRSDPEKSARADDMVSKLEAAIAQVRDDLEKARAAGNEKKVRELEENLASRESFLEMAKRASADFS